MGGEEAEEEKKAQIFDSLSLLEIHLYINHHISPVKYPLLVSTQVQLCESMGQQQLPVKDA